MSDMTVAELAEDREAMDVVCKALIEAAYRHGNKPVAHNGLHPDTLAEALRALANPAPEVPDEPTDPAVRVVDKDGETWALIRSSWLSTSGELCWSDLAASGPLKIVTPDAPTPDADRPLEVGDLVAISETATVAGAGVVKHAFAGSTGKIKYLDADGTWTIDLGNPHTAAALVASDDLTRIPGDPA